MILRALRRSAWPATCCLGTGDTQRARRAHGVCGSRPARSSTMRVSVRIACTTALALVLSGCAEAVLINSDPPGAKAYIDDQTIGTTPAHTKMRRGEVTSDHKWRVDFRNCEPAEGTLQTAIAPG